MQVQLQALLLLPLLFLTLECTRAALWATRVANSEAAADRDGPLLRALCAGLIGVLGMLPTPIWRVMTYVVWVMWVPVRGMLWLWGIGRGGGGGLKKRSPSAVTRWYAYTRARRAEMLRRRRRRRQHASDSYE